MGWQETIETLPRLKNTEAQMSRAGRCGVAAALVTCAHPEWPRALLPECGLQSSSCRVTWHLVQNKTISDPPGDLQKQKLRFDEISEDLIGICVSDIPFPEWLFIKRLRACPGDKAESQRTVWCRVRYSGWRLETQRPDPLWTRKSPPFKRNVRKIYSS